MAYTPPDAIAADFDFTEEGYVPSGATVADFNFTFFVAPPVTNIHRTLAGTSDHIMAVWVYDGKMYVATSDTFSVINLTTHSLIDYYDQTHAGINDETLIGDGIVDINANM